MKPCSMIVEKRGASFGVSTEVSQYLVDQLGIKANKVEMIFNGVNESKLKPLSDQEREQLQQKWKLGPSKITFAMHLRIHLTKNHS